MTISNDTLHKAAQWCLIAVAFLLPVWFLPLTTSPVEFNKELVVAVLVFLSFILYISYSIRSGAISLFYHRTFIVLGLLLLAWLASTLVSGSKSALLGLGAEPNSFFAVLTLFLMSAMIMLLFPDPRSIYRLMLALAWGFVLFLFATWIFSVFGLGRNLHALFASPVFNPIGSWNAAGFAAGFFVVMLYPFLLSSSGKFRLGVTFLFLISLLLVGLVNFRLIWGIIDFFAIFLLAYAIWRKNITLAGVGVPLLLLLFALFGFFFGDLIAEKIAFPAPLEVGVSPRTTLNIIGSALRENLFLGTGPASFGYLWDKYKPIEVNNTLFWGLRFSTGSSYILTMLAEVGLLGWALYLVFFGWIWYLGLSAVAKESDAEGGILAFSAFLVFSYTIVMWALYAVGYTLVALGFLALGILLAVLRKDGFLREHEISLITSGPRGFIAALVLVFFIIAGVLGVYVISTRYIGQLAYARGIEAFNVSGDLELAEKRLRLASRSNNFNDLYLRSLSQIYLTRARLLLQDRATPPDLLGSKFKDFLDSSIAASQGAIRVAPYDFINYRTLGKIYELLVQLNTAGALDAAQAQYDEALKHAPRSPLIWGDKAMAYLSDFSSNGNRDSLKKAEEALVASVELKPDYVLGHFFLAQVYDAEGKTAEAIRRGEAAALLAPNDIGTLFQLGLLYYRSDRLSDARVVFEKAVALNPNYSNARYFLGLIYSRTNRSQDAISEFEKIASLNPDNTEVKTILENLREGRTALSGIAPPAPSPEKRSEPPVRESR